MLKSFPPLEGNLLSIQAVFGHVYKALECSFKPSFKYQLKSDLRALLLFLLKH